MMNSAIQLCFITDETYALPTAVAIESLKANKSPATQYRVHVICRAVSDAGMKRIADVTSQGVEIVLYPNAQLPVDESSISLVRHVSTAAIFKFFIPELLSAVGKVIYLDSDILIQGDLEGLWNVNIRRYYAAVVKDSQSVVGWDQHLKWLEFKEDAYFNSGVMAMNLDLMRRDGLSQKLLEYRIRGKNRFMDQDALNVIFGCRVKYVSYRFNCLNWLFISCTIPQLRELFGDEIKDTVEENLDNAIVLHIGGSEKPWLSNLPYYTEKYRKYSDRIGWHFEFPKVSVIVPVFNAERHLRKCLDGICSQTLTDIDVVCVDNGSTDMSRDILAEYAQRDKRVRVFNVPQKGAGRCRNFGMTRARGEYIGFVDADDYIDSNFFETLYAKVRQEGADVCMCASVRECDDRGRPGKWKRMGVPGLSEVATVRERGSLILSSGVIWNKIYRKDFLTEHGVRFGEEPCAGEDKQFGYGVLFNANKIPIVRDTVYYYRQNGDSTSFKTKGRESFAIIGFYREIHDMLDRAEMSEQDKEQWRDIVRCGRDAEFNLFARRMAPHLRSEFKCKCAEAFYDEAAICKQVDNLVVSLTSYPRRIGTIHHTIRSIIGQSLRPREIVLWLADSQFPGKEQDLPRELLELVPFGLKIRWVEDLRSYKKLIFALRQYPDDCIVIADDDLAYTRYWLEKLWKTHVQSPEDIVFHRARAINVGWRTVKPYSTWKILTHQVRVSNALIVPTGVGGVLYPPHCFTEEIFNRVFMDIAPYADDLWFWAMVLLSGRRFLHVDAYECAFYFTPGSQDESLAAVNVGEGRNDQQLDAIVRRYPQVGAMIRRAAHEDRRQAVRQAIPRFRQALKATLSKGPSCALQFVLPYGAVCFWLRYFRDVEEDKPLLYYHGAAKRWRRVLKFLLPYGAVDAFKRYVISKQTR